MEIRRLLIGYIFYICLSIAVVYIYGFKALSNIWIPLLGYSLLIYPLHIAWSRVRGRIRIDFLSFFILFLYKSAIYLSVCILCIGGFLYYQNYISPAKLPIYTLSNGEQKVIFQTMSHIGSESFYSSVVERISANKKSGAVLYYEGVLPGSNENNRDFNAALGINFTPGLYDNFSKLYGVQAQNNSDFLNIVNNLDYNIDLDLDEVMRLYNMKKTQNPLPTLTGENNKIIDVNTQVIQQLSKLSQRELMVLRYANQGILNFIIKQESLRNMLIKILGNEDIFSVILDDRNKHLANEIMRRKEERVIVLYGLMHFKGVLELLQSDDSSWKIVHTEYEQIITQDL